MSEEKAQIRKLLRQQAALARFGSFALRQDSLLPVLTEAARVCAEGLDAPFSKICRYRPADNDLLIEAGVGWNDGVVGHVVSRADSSSPQGRAFVTGSHPSARISTPSAILPYRHSTLSMTSFLRLTWS